MMVNVPPTGSLSSVKHLQLISCFLLFALSTSAQNWKVAVDRGQLPTVEPKADGVLVTSPHFNAKFLVPTTPSPFVLVGWMKGHENYQHILHNLATGTQLGPVSSKRNLHAFSRLSPDGRHLVGRLSVPGGWTVGVFETATGKVVWQDREGEGILPYSDFVDGQRIIEVSGKTMKVWNFKTGKLDKTITPKDGLAVSGAIFSPNRKLLARMESGGTIRLYDMPGGRLSGELTLPGVNGRKIETALMDIGADGLELAAIVRLSAEKRKTTDNRYLLAAWDLRTGKVIASQEIERADYHALDGMGSDAGIDVLPNQRGWLRRTRRRPIRRRPQLSRRRKSTRPARSRRRTSPRPPASGETPSGPRSTRRHRPRRQGDSGGGQGPRQRRPAAGC